MANFEQSVNQRLHRLNQARLERESIAADDQRQINATRAFWDKRNEANLGTPPSEVFGAEEARICGQFITYMASRDFPGAVSLTKRHREPAEYKNKRFRRGRVEVRPSKMVTDFEIKAYGIGIIGNPDKQARARMNDGTYVTNKGQSFMPVFLCADGDLRTSNDGAQPVMSPPYIGRLSTRSSLTGGWTDLGYQESESWQEFRPVALATLLVDLAVQHVTKGLA